VTRLGYLSLLLALAGCVTAPKAEPRYLPAGVYHHDVTVALEGKDPMRFPGILKIDHGKLTMIMLSQFGTTLVRLNDEVHADAVRVAIYADDLKEVEERLVAVYRALKPVLLDVGATEVEVYGRTMTVTHTGTVPPGVPRTTVIEGAGVRLSMEVTRYETTGR
jgi:hypothetical protein